MKTKTLLHTLALLGLLGSFAQAAPMGTTFTYQGALNAGADTANGVYDFNFALYDVASGGVPIRNFSTNAVHVADGLFTVLLDFGSVFPGDARWLEISVKTNGAAGFTKLAPRQEMTPAPYSLFAPNAGNAALFNGQNPAAFAPASGSSAYVAKAGDTMTGSLWVNAADGLRVGANQLVLAGGNVGIGTATPLAKLHVNGLLQAAGDVKAARLNVGSGHTLGGAATTIAGGIGNQVTGDYATVGGGSGNLTFGLSATIAGGYNNQATNDATIGGGVQNTAGGTRSTISGGSFNSATASYATVGGGGANIASGVSATIAGGYDNQATEGASLGGGVQNRATGLGSAIVGGRYNAAAALYATVAGGNGNTANGAETFLGGGWGNGANATSSTIGGGRGNLISPGADYSFLGGGRDNSASGEASTISGGYGNSVAGHYSLVAGGIWNRAPGYTATVGGGCTNNATDNWATVGGGYGNTASGRASTVPGGYDNLAAGSYSFAAGRHARAQGVGSFVWADSSDFPVVAWNHDEFVARATGGFWLFTGIDGIGLPTSGVTLAAGSGTWASWCDRNSKTNCLPADPREVLDKVAALPIASWNYKAQDPSIRHIGPMAQDFHAVFGLGDSDKSIATVDADGVALAAIQGLNQKVEEQAAQIHAKDAALAELRARLDALEMRLSKPASN